MLQRDYFFFSFELNGFIEKGIMFKFKRDKDPIGIFFVRLGLKFVKIFNFTNFKVAFNKISKDFIKVQVLIGKKRKNYSNTIV